MYIIFYTYIVILFYSLLIQCADYHHHELQQLFYKAITHFNSYLQELQSIIHSYAEITDRKKFIIYL